MRPDLRLTGRTKTEVPQAMDEAREELTGAPQSTRKYTVRLRDSSGWPSGFCARLDSPISL